MSTEVDIDTLREQFLELARQDDVLKVRELLNHQNISDVAELINDTA